MPSLVTQISACIIFWCFLRNYFPSVSSIMNIFILGGFQLIVENHVDVSSMVWEAILEKARYCSKENHHS